MAISKPIVLKTSSIFLCLILWLGSHPIIAQPIDSVYHLQTGREAALLGGGLATVALSLVTGVAVKPLDPTAILALNRQQLSAFNRDATYHWSPTADRISDLTLLGNVGLVELVALPNLRKKNWLNVPVMYLETMLLTNGIQRTIKHVSLTRRPYVYNPDVSLSEKTKKDALRSFFSSHATNAFASAVFAGEVFGRQFPHSRWKPVVWGGALALATTGAVLRYEAGQHFPADLIVGAAFGSAMGWVVPKLHQRRLGDQLTVLPWSNGLASGVYVQYVPVYR